MSAPSLPHLVDRQELRKEMGIPRSTIDAIYRLLPTLGFPGHKKRFVRRADVIDLIERGTWVDDGTRVRP